MNLYLKCPSSSVYLLSWVGFSTITYLSLFITICHISMSLHISLSHLHRKRDFAASLYPRDFSSLSFCYQLWVINEKSCTFSEPAKEFKASVVFNWCEHANTFLDNAGLDGHMGASIRLDILITIRIQVCAIYDDLRPAVWIH